MGNVDIPEPLIETTVVQTEPAKPKLSPEEEERIALQIKKHEDAKSNWKKLCLAKFPHLEELADSKLDEIIEIYMRDEGKSLGKLNQEDRLAKKEEVKKTQKKK